MHGGARLADSLLARAVLSRGLPSCGQNARRCFRFCRSRRRARARSSSGRCRSTSTASPCSSRSRRPSRSPGSGGRGAAATGTSSSASPSGASPSGSSERGSTTSSRAGTSCPTSGGAPFAIWKGGLGVWGGIGLGCIVGAIVAKRSGVSVAKLADCVAPGLLVAQGIGRFGNWWNQELFGKPTDLPWGLEIDPANRPIDDIDQATFQPTFLYEALWCFAAAGLLLLIERRFKGRIRTGNLFALYVLIYSVGRLWIETLRIDPAHEIGGVRLNVYVAGYGDRARGGVLRLAGRRSWKRTGREARRRRSRPWRFRRAAERDPPRRGRCMSRKRSEGGIPCVSSSFSARSSALSVLPSLAAGGGWASVGFEPLPDGTAAGGTWTPTIFVKQHGITPLAGLQPVVMIEEVGSGASTKFLATAGSEAGEYEADVVFPSTGSWRVRILSGFGDSQVTYGPVAIGAGRCGRRHAAASARRARGGGDRLRRCDRRSSWHGDLAG